MMRLAHGSCRCCRDRRLVGDGDDARSARVHSDTRTLQPGDLFVALRGERFDGHEFLAARTRGPARWRRSSSAACRRAGLPRPARSTSTPRARSANWPRRGARAFTLPARRRHRLPARPRTKELIAAILRAAYGDAAATEGSLNNETGLPLTSCSALRPPAASACSRWACAARADRVPAEDRRARHRRRRQRRAPRTSSGSARPTRHRDAPRPRSGAGLGAGGTVGACPSSDRCSPRWRAHAPARAHVTFGDARRATFACSTYAPRARAARDRPLDAVGVRSVERLQLVGKHVAIDACAALAAAHAAGVAVDAAAAALRRARRRRCAARCLEVARPHVIVDCYNANPASMAAALAPARGGRAGGRARASRCSATCSSSAITPSGAPGGRRARRQLGLGVRRARRLTPTAVVDGARGRPDAERTVAPAAGRRGARSRAHRARRLDPAQGLARHAARDASSTRCEEARPRCCSTCSTTCSRARRVSASSAIRRRASSPPRSPRSLLSFLIGAVVHRARSSRARSARRSARTVRPDAQEEGGHADDGRLADPVLLSPCRRCCGATCAARSCGSRCWSPSASARSASSTTT